MRAARVLSNCTATRESRPSQRYRVERFIDGGPFKEIERRPGAAAEARDRTEPGRPDRQISYRVSEWAGKQKIYSDAVSLSAHAAGSRKEP